MYLTAYVCPPYCLFLLDTGAIVNPLDEPMLVMEYMDYGSLSDMLHNETMVLEPEIIIPMLQDITQGCRFLHAADPQVIHGDLKAANILVDSKFRAKVADFGLTQKKTKLNDGGGVGVSGTLFFMAPELLRQETSNTAASDVYAFGIILYEVFSRKDPYEGEELATVIRQVADPALHKRPPVPNNCPPVIISLMSDCLVENPEARPTFEELDKRMLRVDVKDAAEFSTPNKRASRMGTSSNRATTVSLFDIFPKHIAEALRDGKKVEAEHRDVVTIFFCDIGECRLTLFLCWLLICCRSMDVFSQYATITHHFISVFHLQSDLLLFLRHWSLERLPTCWTDSITSLMISPITMISSRLKRLVMPGWVLPIVSRINPTIM
jgi:serine/threonine protein kinase